MNWKLKAYIQRCCAVAPFGGAAYMFLQRSAGRLRNYNYEARFRQQADLAMRLRKHGKEIDGAVVMEVGTGWMPLVPVGFWMCGAKSVVTYDLNRYLSYSLLGKILKWMCANEDLLVDVWKEMLQPEKVHEHIEMIRPLIFQPERFLREAGIKYAAPDDAADSPMLDESIDIHVSTSVFEHIPENVLRDILREASRLLREDGLAIHLIDPIDHFAHGNSSIPLFNFMQFDEKTWKKYSNNRFGYHNRLIDRDYRQIFEESPLNLIETDFRTDEPSINLIRNGFPLAKQFKDTPPEELCRRDLYYIASSGRMPRCAS